MVGMMASGFGVLELPWVDQVSIALGIVLIALGVHIARSGEHSLEQLRRISRPAPTMLAMTLANPLSLAVWLGVVTALPPETLAPGSWIRFAVGVTIASLGWHIALALGGAWAGPRMTPRVRRWSAIAGGVVVGLIGVALIA
jgi:arginine exporter protein ArgO